MGQTASRTPPGLILFMMEEAIPFQFSLKKYLNKFVSTVKLGNKEPFGEPKIVP